MKTLVPMLKELREGKHGCGNHNIDMTEIKKIHKKLKKCRGWGKSNTHSSSSSSSKKEKKNKKRSSADPENNGGAGGEDQQPKKKKAKA